MSTYRFLVADIKKTHGEAFTDSKITSTHVLYWILLVANRLRKDMHIKTDSGLYLNTFSPVPVLIDTNLKNRQYIELPAAIFDLPYDRSIKYITYNVDTCCCEGPAFAQTFFQPTTAIRSWLLYLNPYTNPKSTNPYFYRVENRLYFLGTECITVKDVEIQLLNALDPLTEVNVDDPIGLSDEMISVLRYEVISLAKYAYLLPQERKNLGTDPTGGEKQVLASVKARQDAPQQSQEE